MLLRGAEGAIWLGFLVILFAENGIGQAVVESFSGAEAAALLIHETPRSDEAAPEAWEPRGADGPPASEWIPRDAGLWIFVAAMVLYHAANAPGGVDLG